MYLFLSEYRVQGRASFRGQLREQSEPVKNHVAGQRQPADVQPTSTASGQLHVHRQRPVRVRTNRSVARQQFLPFPAVAGGRVLRRIVRFYTR